MAPPRRTRPRHSSPDPASFEPENPVDRYAAAVLTGETVAGPLVRAACKRHVMDRQHGHERGLRFVWGEEQPDDPDDPMQRGAAHACGFFSRVLRLSGGQYEGRPFALHPSQVFIVGSLFGWKRADGLRRYRVAYIEIGKGGGKTPSAAGMALYMLTADKEPGAQVFAAAVDRDQASIAFADAVAMIDKAPALSRRLTRSGGMGREFNVADLATGSFFRPLSSDSKGKGKSGYRVHCAILDEVHEHPTDAMIEFIRANTKGRRQPLILMITNSGSTRNSVAWRYHEYAERVLEGTFDNDEFFAYICALDADDDWRDEAVWIKANPLLDVGLPGMDYLRQQTREARGMPSKQGVVRRLNFCQWTETENAWLGAEIWDEAEDPGLRLDDLAGRECVVGFDLSHGANVTRGDTSALALVFPGADGTLAALFRFYLPSEGLAQRAEDTGTPYPLWRDMGHLTTTPGRLVDERVVAADIAALSRRFRVTAVVGDAYRLIALDRALTELGVTVPRVLHPQGFRKSKDSALWMPGSVAATERALIERRLRIERNPMLRWMTASTAMRADAENNRTPSKAEADRQGAHIDGVVALIAAVGQITGGRVEQPKSYQMLVMSRGP